MRGVADETIRVELPQDAGNELIEMLRSSGIDHSAAISRQMTGETLFVAVILPVTLTAVQVLTAFVLAKRQPESKTPEVRIEVKHRFVKMEDFSIEEVETIVERRLIE